MNRRNAAGSRAGGGCEEEQMQDIEEIRRRLRQRWNTHKRDRWIRKTRKGFDETEYILRWCNEFCTAIGVKRSDLSVAARQKLFEVASIEYRNQKKILKWRRRRALPTAVCHHITSEESTVSIQRFCEELAILWQRCPEMRFGQLVVNALGVDPFYIEDNEVLWRIECFVSKQKVSLEQYVSK